MKALDPGILPQSVCFSFTPPELSKRLLFYATWCGHYYCTDRYFIRRDFYPPLLVMFVRKGVFRVEYRGERRKARQGDTILLDCSEPHYYRAEDGLEFLYIHFDGSNAHEICRYVMERDGWLIRRDSNLQIAELIHDMVELYERGGVETPFEMSMRVYRLIGLLTAPAAPETESAGPVDKAVQHIRANVGKAFTLEELAAISNLSPFYFSRRFKRQTGFAPMEYVINTRIDQAKVLLIRSTKSVEEIAWEVGYASAGSFINVFVKRIGISPTQFRKEHRSQSGDNP